jgi:hypothetical protein
VDLKGYENSGDWNRGDGDDGDLGIVVMRLSVTIFLKLIYRFRYSYLDKVFLKWGKH